jgi:hypothetical protein
MRALRLFASLVLGAAALGAMLPAQAEPLSPTTYEATAAADGLRVSTTVPGAPLSDAVVDLSSGSAQAVVNGLGSSRALAAVPYPGPTLTTLPDTVRGASGAPVPSYPLVAGSEFPGTPEAHVSQPGVSLEARSGARTSEATATTGAGGDPRRGRAVSAAQAGSGEAGTVLAEATTEISGLVIGPLIITRVASRALVMRGAAGEPRRESSLESTLLVVSGQPVGVGPGGLTVAGTTTPLPDTHPARVALERAGVAVRYLEPADTPDGVVAPGLAITQVVPVSLTGPPSKVMYTVGRASASVAVGAAPIVDGVGLAGSTPAQGESRPLPVESASPIAPVASRANTGEEAMTAPAVPSAEPDRAGEVFQSTLPSAAHTVADPAPPASVSAAAKRALFAPRPEMWPNTFYGLFVLAGSVIVTLCWLLRHLGVKTTWVS